MRPLLRLMCALTLVLAAAACSDRLANPRAPATTPATPVSGVPAPLFDLGGSAYLGIPSTVLDFGEVQVGTTSAPESARVTNLGFGPILMNGAGGNPGGAFTGAQSCQGLTLAVGGSCYLIYNFLPSSAGPASAVSAGTWNGQPFNITLRGVGVGPQLAINPSGIDFGTVAVGSVSKTDSVLVMNVGKGPLLMNGAGGNPGGQFTGAQSCQGLTLPVGGKCYLIYNFLPSAGGADSAVSAGTWSGLPFNVRLRGVGVAPTFRIATYAIDFGQVPVGTVSKTDSAKVTNIGPVPVVMNGAGGNPGGQFSGAQSCQGLTLAPGASCYLIYNFLPSSTGTTSAVSAGTWNGYPFHVDLVGTGITSGTSPTTLFRIERTGIDFGNIQVGTVSQTDSVAITNISSAPVLMNGAGGNPGGQFTGAQSCQGITLAVGAKCYLIYNFLPTAAGADSAVSSGTWNGQPFNIKLRGNAVRPNLHIDPSGFDFGDVQVGTVSKTDSAKITNIGLAPVTMNGAGGNPGGEFTGAQSCQGLTLAVGASCYLIYNFLPSAVGPASALSAGTWNGAPFSVTLKGNGVPPKLLITPAGFDFGRVQLGTVSMTDSAEITNVGLAPLQMNGAGGNPGGEFTGAQSCQGLTLPVGGKCYLIYNFLPSTPGADTAVSAGTWSGLPFNIPLTGVGVLGSQAMDLSPATISLSGTVTTSAVLLSGPGFDATAVDLNSVRMLVNSTTDVSPLSRSGIVISSVRDWNGDGLMDRMFSFRTSALTAAGLTTSATPASLILHGMLTGQSWQATDSALPTFVP